MTYNEIFIVRFAGGRIAETWGVVDVFSQMEQLGVIPAKRSLSIASSDANGSTAKRRGAAEFQARPGP